MAAMKLAENLYSVGALNPALRIFDIIMTAEYGTTYNSFLITGDKNVLIDACHETFFDEFCENINSVVDIRNIDYLITNHTEPDHSGCIQKLLAVNPDIEILSSPSGNKFLQNLCNEPFKGRVVNTGDTLETGIGTLEFIVSPMLHWPDSMFTYWPEAKTLFTCDFLGAHYCEPQMLDTRIHYPDKYLESFRYYFDCIFGPFKSFVIQGLDKIKGLDIERVCVSHGPILTESIQDRIADYRAWSKPSAKGDKPVMAICYASAYNYTRKLAEAAYEAVKDRSEVYMLDVVEANPEEVAAIANRADALMVGSCTINRDSVKPIWTLLSSIEAVGAAGKPAAAFGSYGWTGEAVPMIKERLSNLKYRFIGDGYRCIFRPTDEDFAAMANYAREVLDAVK